MAFTPRNIEINSKNDIRWINNIEAIDESVTNRPIDDVENFANTVKSNAIFADPSQKGLTNQTISGQLKLNSVLKLTAGDSNGLGIVSGVNGSTDTATITLATDSNSKQYLKLKSLNTNNDEIHLQTIGSTSLKADIYETNKYNSYTIWHAGNDGAASGLDADLIRGMDITSDSSINTVVNRNSSGNFSANVITATLNGNATNVSGIVSAVNGGTGINSYTVGDMLIADSSTSISKVSVGNTNTVLFSNGLGRTPSWRSIQGSDLTGIVSVSNGGTGKNTLSGVLFGNGTNAVSSASGQQIVDVIDETPVKNASYAAIAASLEEYSQDKGVSLNNMKGFSSTLSDIKSNGVASLGTSQYVASVDHIHPSDNTRAPKDSPYFTNYIRIPQGTLSNQSIRFGNLDKTGLYSTSDTSLNVAVNNSDNIQLSSTSTTILKNVSLPSTTTIGSVSGTEISYISGARSNIQNQIDAFMYQVPAGAVIFTASQSLPTGYLIANGAEVSRTQFAALFSSIGTTYGSGNGSTTFNVPNLKGKIPVKPGYKKYAEAFEIG